MLENEFVQKDVKQQMEKNWNLLIQININKDIDSFKELISTELYNINMEHINYMNNQRKLVWLARCKDILSGVLKEGFGDKMGGMTQEKIWDLQTYVDR